MPFDGISAKFITDTFNRDLTGGRVEKALQPERDEIVLVIRARGENHRLLLSASANCARIQITKNQKENPAVPPVFCMLLRKHIVGGKVEKFSHADFDRIIEIEFLTTNDFGESCKKYIVIEIMGRYSNIMLLNEDKKIIDSVKHIDFDISSVREVMPGRQYVLPPQQDKISPQLLISNKNECRQVFLPENTNEIKEMRIDKFILERIKGFSPMLAREICELSDIDPKHRCNEILFGTDSLKNIDLLSSALHSLFEKLDVQENTSNVFFKDHSMNQSFDFYFMDMKQYEFKKSFSSFCEAMDFFYSSKDKSERLTQKKSDLTRVISNNIDRCLKKIGIQNAALKEAAESDKYKLFGELITANIYRIEPNISNISLVNYYSETSENVNIPLDPHKSAVNNAQLYFKKYTKAKSTGLNAAKQLTDAENELAYLQSAMQMLELSSDSNEIAEMRAELSAGSYIKVKSKKNKNGKNAKEKTISKPKSYCSEDGFEILVGKSNVQNDYLTLKLASNSDYWFHTKNIPGSHVIIRAKGQAVSDSTILEAASLAAHFSKASSSDNVPVDYTFVRNVHKPSGAKPGMVIYENQKTVYVTPFNPEK